MEIKQRPYWEQTNVSWPSAPIRICFWSQSFDSLQFTVDGIISAMDFDWLTGNIYLATSEGHILACNAQTNSSLNCASTLSGQGSVYGIAVDPNQG